MKRWRPPRPLLLIALLLLAGAVVNVAVAWGIVLCEPASREPVVLYRSPSKWNPRPGEAWEGEVPSDWPRVAEADGPVNRGFGLRVVTQATVAKDADGFEVRPHGSYIAQTRHCGWPLLALHGTNAMEEREGQGLASRNPWRISGISTDSTPFVPGRKDETHLPLLPRPVAFLVNTLFYAAILALPLSVFPIRRRLRARRGRCPKCGYDLAGLRRAAGKEGADPAAPCPECGAAR
jgi:hypothetical protein